MNKAREYGFTLIELLTVIAIISILAAMTAVTLPGILERAKVASTRATMKQLHNALDTYYADHGSYPPAYGYLKVNPAYIDTSRPDWLTNAYFLYPYLAILGYYNNETFTDEFPMQGDTDRDGYIGLLEYYPVEVQVGVGESYFDTSSIYDTELTVEQMAGHPMLDRTHPYIYIPVNLKQVKRVAKYYQNIINSNSSSPQDKIDALYANMWDGSDTQLSRLSFPPPRYDAFIILSAGPGYSTSGILPMSWDYEFTAPEALHHITALRAYYLATRDLNANGLLDFDYEARLKSGEDNLESFAAITSSLGLDSSIPGQQLTRTPNGESLYGPLIMAIGGQ